MTTALRADLHSLQHTPLRNFDRAMAYSTHHVRQGVLARSPPLRTLLPMRHLADIIDTIFTELMALIDRMLDRPARGTPPSSSG